MAPSPKDDHQPTPGRLMGFRAAQDSRRLCGTTPAAPSGHDTSFHEGLRRGECGAPACAALPLSPASALRSPVFISHVWLASHQEFRLNAFQVMEEGADPGGLRRWGPELTLMPSPLTTCWACCGTHCPTASASSQNPQTPHSWCRPLPFFKKRSFLTVNLLFLAPGQALQFPLLSLQTWGFGRRETALPRPQRGVVPLQGTYPRTLSLWDGQTQKALTTHPTWGGEGPCHLALSPSTGPFAVPCPTLPPPQLLALARTAAEEGWTQ